MGRRNKLNSEVHSSGNSNIFRKLLLNFIRPSASKDYNINDMIGFISLPEKIKT